MKGFVVVATLGLVLVASVPAFADDSLDPGYPSDSRFSALAPADTYFGRLRMSILGIRNAIRDVAIRVDAASEDDLPVLYHKLTLVEDALIDLKRRYPLDTWVPQLTLNLAQAYGKLPFGAAQARANDNLDGLIADYPDTDQALYAMDLRDARLRPRTAADNIPIEPVLPSYAVPSH